VLRRSDHRDTAWILLGKAATRTNPTESRDLPHERGRKHGTAVDYSAKPTRRGRPAAVDPPRSTRRGRPADALRAAERAVPEGVRYRPWPQIPPANCHKRPASATSPLMAS